MLCHLPLSPLLLRHWMMVGLASLTTMASGGDWSQWRGPNRDGVVPDAASLPGWQAAGPQTVWRADVGTGFSSFAIAQGRVFTSGNRDEADVLTCLDAGTGAVLWTQSHPEPLDPNLFEGGPTSTPAVGSEQVYTFSRRGQLQGRDVRTGELAWEVNIPETCGLRVPTWGFASSPVLWNGRLLLNAGRAGVAVDAQSGQVLWQSDDEDDAAYATPVLARINNEPTVLILSAKALHAVDPLTGAESWDYRWITRYGINAADPIVHGDRLWLSSGYGKGAVLLEISSEDDPPREVYRSRELRNQMAPGVLVDGCIYAVDGDAGDECSLKCLEFATGTVHWSHAGLGSATLISVGGDLVILSEAGELLIAPASRDGFSPRLRAQVLSGKCWTPPAYANGRLYCRNAAGEVVCLAVGPADPDCR